MFPFQSVVHWGWSQGLWAGTTFSTPTPIPSVNLASVHTLKWLLLNGDLFILLLLSDPHLHTLLPVLPLRCWERRTRLGAFKLCHLWRKQQKQLVRKKERLLLHRECFIKHILTGGGCCVLPGALDLQEDGVGVVGKQKPSDQTEYLRNNDNSGSESQ